MHDSTQDTTQNKAPDTPLSSSLLQEYLYALVKRYPWFFAGLVSLAFIAGYLSVAVEYKIKEIIDAIADTGPGGVGMLIFLFAFYKTLYHGVFFVRRLLDIRYMPRILEDTVTDMYQKVVNHSLHWFDSHLAGEVSNKVFDFEGGISVLVRSSFSLLKTCIAVILALGFLMTVNAQTALVLFVFIMIYVPVIFVLLKYQLTLYEKTTLARQSVVGLVNDSISNIFAVKVIGNVLLEFANKLKPSISAWRETDRKARHADAWIIDSVDTLLVVVMSATQMYLLAVLLRDGSITAGDFAFIAIITLGIHSQLETFLDLLLFSINPSIAKIKASMEYVFTPVDVVDQPGAKALLTSKGALSFDQVTYGYDSRAPILQDFSLQIQPGERLGVVGTSGAGKTTLIKCLLRYFDVSSGKVCIDGQDIQNLTQVSLRAQISIIPQDIAMFHRSIKANLLLAKPDATQEQLIYACTKASIHEDIMAMPEAYDTIVGERGVKLSGGQRQRVAIARAILKNAPILIFDEATSSLDTGTEQLIQASLQEMLQSSQATVIAIAHRLSTLKTMDRIIVMDKGTLLEQGTHDELIALQGKYYELWQMQV